MKKRACGILCHISSLPSPFGIGDFGPAAYAFADFLADTKQSYWQVLPLNPTNLGKGSSPFNSLSAFAGNVLLISPEMLREEGLLTGAESHYYPSDSDAQVDYSEVWKHKKEILSKAYDAFTKTSPNRSDYEYFCRENAFWLEDHAIFCALILTWEGKPTCEWPEQVKHKGSAELKKVREELRERQLLLVDFAFQADAQSL
jgi:4-alpha-glucanotransferase